MNVAIVFAIVGAVGHAATGYLLCHATSNGEAFRTAPNGMRRK